MKKQLDSLQIPHTFIEAVNGKSKSASFFPQYDHQKRMTMMGRAMTGTEVACTLSHLKAMEYALSKGMTRVCIVEDDGILKANFLSQLKYSFSLPSKFEFLSLYNNKVKDSPVLSLKRSRYKQWSGALGYVITAEAMGKVLSCNKEVLFIADQALMGRPEMNMRVWYLLPKAIQLSDELESDIGDARNTRNYTFENRLRRIRYQLTSWLERWSYVCRHISEYIFKPKV